jgi:hypothetical protein
MRRAPIAIAAALLVVACGSSSKPASTGTTANTSADRSRAQSLVLSESDYPAGWTTTPASTDKSDSAAEQKLTACAGGSSKEEQSVTVDGPDATKDNAQVSSSATIVKTDAAFKKDVDALNSSKLQSCMRDVVTGLVQSSMDADESGAKVGNVAIAPLSTPTFGAVTKAFRFTIPVNANGDTTTVYVDFVAFGKDRAEVTLSIANVGEPLDSATEQSLLQKAGAKLK